MDAVANYWSHLCIETAVGQIAQYRSKLVFKFLQLPHCVKSAQIRGYFWLVFSCNRTEYVGILRISPYSVQIQENTSQK